MRLHRRSFRAFRPCAVAGLVLLAGCATQPRSGAPMAGTDPGPAARPLEREAAPLTRQQAPTSMGTPVVTGTTGDGRPAIDYIGTPTGNAAPGGTAVVQGSGSAERARRSP